MVDATRPMKVVSLILLSVMTCLTAIGLLPDFATFLLAQGSDGLMSHAAFDPIAQVLLVALFGLCSYGRNRNMRLVAQATVFAVWVLSGRVVSIFPDGRLGRGWFYVETARVNLCPDSGDCEVTYYYDTQVETLAGWRVRVSNAHVNETFFVGPLLLPRVVRLLKARLPNMEHEGAQQ